ncbi:MAG: hypothetical protein IT357_15850 [Gemmatimonadaceae bacterium]|nr:hypothetical protein [Gemmatimonadaceae bacterium]
MRQFPSLALLLLLTALACSDATGPLVPTGTTPADALGDPPRKIRVTNAADAGPGSFRAALEEASADPAVVGISFNAGIGDLIPASALTFTGTQALTIDANMAVIVGDQCACDALVFNTSASVLLSRLSVHQVVSGVAIAVNVAESATGTLNVSLNQVHVDASGKHALVVNDLAGSLADTNSAASAGSAASLRVDIIASTFRSIANDIHPETGTVYAIADQDAVRINEGGDGDVIVNIRTAEFYQNGGDDVQVDERGNGSVDLRVDGAVFWYTGYFSAVGTGDGLRVEESDAGNLSVRATGAHFTGGRGQAIDLSENGAGDLYLYTARSTMFDGDDTRIVVREDDRVAGGGNLTVDLADDTHIATNGPWYSVQGPDPMESQLVIHEKGEGHVDARLTRSGVNRGVWSGGILVREDAGGNLRATMRSFGNYGNAHSGLILDENGAGDLIAALTEGFLVGNGGYAIEATQEAPGAGSLSLTAMQIFENRGPSGDTPHIEGLVTVRYY